MGGWGRDWASNILSKVEEVEFVGCVDSDPEALAKARASTAIQAEAYFDSLDTALESVEVGAVLVTTALPGHVPVALAALEAGKHVLMEKPFAPTIEEARQVVDAAAEKGLVLMISQNYRFFPAVRAAQSLVQAGELGEVGAISIDFRRYSNRAPRGGSRHYTMRQPLLVDMAIHHFDLMRAVLGREPREVFCHASNPPWSKFEDSPAAAATITFDGGAVVSYRGSWVSTGPATPWAGEWRMELSEAEVTWTSRGDGRPIESQDELTVRHLGEPPRKSDLPTLTYVDRAGSLSAFANAIRTGREPETSGRDNLRTLALMSAAVESAASGAPVRLDAHNAPRTQ